MRKPPLRSQPTSTYQAPKTTIRRTRISSNCFRIYLSRRPRWYHLSHRRHDRSNLPYAARLQQVTPRVNGDRPLRHFFNEENTSDPWPCGQKTRRRPSETSLTLLSSSPPEESRLPLSQFTKYEILYPRENRLNRDRYRQNLVL